MEIAVLVIGAILVLFGYFKLKAKAKRRAAALNLVLAKATFLSLPHDDQVRVHDQAVNDLNQMMGGRFRGFNGEYDQFGCYAHAMAHLGIPPIVKDYPRWFLVHNPFFDIMPNDPLIDKTIQEMKCKHGVDVTISKEHRMFDKIRGPRVA
jgi:hypothetical protein